MRGEVGVPDVFARRWCMKVRRIGRDNVISTGRVLTQLPDPLFLGLARERQGRRCCLHVSARRCPGLDRPCESTHAATRCPTLMLLCTGELQVFRVPPLSLQSASAHFRSSHLTRPYVAAQQKHGSSRKQPYPPNPQGSFILLSFRCTEEKKCSYIAMRPTR